MRIQMCAGKARCGAYWKVVGVKTCHSPTTFGGYGITFFQLLVSTDVDSLSDGIQHVKCTGPYNILIMHEFLCIVWPQVLTDFQNCFLMSIKIILPGAKK